MGSVCCMINRYQTNPPMNTNLNRALLTWIGPSGKKTTVLANDDLRLAPDQMQIWIDSMNQYLVRSGAYANGSRYHLG